MFDVLCTFKRVQFQKRAFTTVALHFLAPVANHRRENKYKAIYIHAYRLEEAIFECKELKEIY